MKSRAQGLRIARFVSIAVGAAALAAAPACATSGDQEAQELQEESAAREREAARHQVRPSPVETVLEAVREDGFLSAEQELEIDGLAEQAEGEREGLRALHEEVRASAVSAVRAGSADSADFDRAVEDGVRAVEGSVQRSLDALEQLHAILEPDQRVAVAENLRTRLEARLATRAEDRARCEAASGAGADRDGADRDGADRDGADRDGFARFASYLVLSRAQVAELSAVQKELLGEKKKLRPSREELHALIDAFEGEDFGLALDTMHAEKSRVLRVRVARASAKADTVLSIFTPEQRDLLADLILEGPEKLLLGEKAEIDG